MSKLFWGLLTLFSLALTAWSGFYVYNELNLKPTAEVPLVPVAPPESVPAPLDVSTITTNVSISTATIEDISIPEEKSAPTRKIVKGKEVKEFKIKNGTAKKVFLVGQFNKWFRQPMKRQGDTWSVTLSLSPGTYEYVFVVVDEQTASTGRRITDSENPHTTTDGKLSLITIDPLPKKN